MEQLIAEQLEPLLQVIVRHKLGLWLRLQHEEAADVQGEIRLRLLERLQRLRRGEEAPIRDLSAYVAVVSYHGCAAYVRRHSPERWRLQHRLRHLLTHYPQFRLRQEAEAEWLGGLASWAEAHSGRLSQTQVQQLLDGPLPPPLASVPDPTFTRHRPEQQLQALLQWAAHWITLDELVAIFAQWWKVKDPPPASLHPAAPPPAAAQQVEQRLYLQKIWQEITALPLRQRQALLLNLREIGDPNAIVLFPALHIASLHDIAAALELSPTEFATLWPRLPLEDNEIAARLHLTRRQVINLRKVARVRLARRASNW
ncbi:MAG: hypothetical protein U0Y68_01150 [Blastocatellia bacterium]